MEIPSEVNLEKHQSWTVFRLHKVPFCTGDSSTQSAAISANGSLDHRGGDFCSKAQSSLFTHEKDFVCARDKNIHPVESVCFQEPEERSVIPGTVTQDCCGNFPPPDPEAEEQSPHAVQNHPDQTLDLNCEYLKTDQKNLDPIPVNVDSIPTTEVPAAVPECGWRVLDLPHIVKHKQSFITFSDYTCPTRGNSYAFVNEILDDGGSSQEGEKEDDDRHPDGDNDDDNDDVFLELPHSRDLLVCLKQRSTGKDEESEKSCTSAQAGNDYTPRSSGYEAEGETSSEKESPQVASPWSESITQLMRKLDQLNLDIEEALSASSSPSSTPCTTRKKQWGGALSKSTLNRSLNDQVPQRPEREECQSRDRSSTPRSSSIGTRARTKKTMFTKVTNAAGAAGLQEPLLTHEYEKARWCSV